MLGPKEKQDWRDSLELYYPRVRGWFGHVLADKAEVDDLTQEVFVRLCDRLTRGEVVRSPWNFIKVTARNVFMEHLRARRKQNALLPLDEEMTADRLPQPAQVHARQEMLEAIPQLLIHLAEDQRYILVGRYFLGLTVRELAEAMGIAASTVIERHTRAVRQLRQLAVSRGITL